MFKRRLLCCLLLLTLLVNLSLSWERSRAQDINPASNAALRQTPAGIPEAAWSRPIGLPFDNPSHEKVDYTMIDDGPVQGLPFGGFGAGTFARTYAGDFARWHMDIGSHTYQTIPADMFSVYTQQGDQTSAQALWTGQPSNLDAWNWNYPVGEGTYYALYPRSWFTYDAFPADIQVEQYSPVLPNDYQASSYPIAMFNWTASNPTDEPITVGVMFTWQNDIGARGTRVNTVLEEDTPLGRMVGIQLGNSEPFSETEGQGSVVLAALETPGVSVSYRSRFATNSDGADIWNDFAADGALDNVEPEISQAREVPGAGVAITFELQPGATVTAPFVLAWDLPVMSFGAGENWFKRYTAFFGRDGDNAGAIAAEGLARNADWIAAIEAWQNPILDDPNRPLWYKTALFNELYYLADGGSAWEHGRVGEPDPGPDYFGRFAYLESPDYAFYNTFDVDFYASYAILELWPDIELRIMRDFAATVPTEDTSTFTVQSSGDQVQRKIVGAVPHDMGSPTEAPWIRNNAFTWQNVNLWKDLPAKFVLRLHRDAILLDQPELIEELWPAAVTAMEYLATMDDNGDGIPENDGIPDQTYDTWPATGISAYSGDLWLSALAAMSDMATRLGDNDAAQSYSDQLEIARGLFEATLWNGQYYNYDETSDAIMADQLAGEWYSRISGIPVLPDAQVDSALTAIYNYNVLQYNEGQMGAVNGMYPDGTVVDSEQAAEVWGGTTYMAAAFMLYRGLDDVAWGTAFGCYKFIYETGGLWFRTPEAWNTEGYRASMYMRPLAIWAMETALERR